MKKQLLHLTIGSLILMYSISNAQPVLVASDINTVVGETYTNTYTNYVDPGNSGANQTWDFSTMTASTTVPTTVLSVSSTPNGASFAVANIASSTSVATMYFKTSSVALQNYGIVGGGVVISYSDPEDFLRYPFAYTDNYIDSWKATFVNAGSTFYRSGTTTVTADGYGTLITPSGTFANAVRVHFVQVYKDSANIAGSPYIINYNNDQYMWYRNGVHAQIASVYNLTTSLSGTPSKGGIYLSSPLGIDNLNNADNVFNLFPNPASDQLNNLSCDLLLTRMCL